MVKIGSVPSQVRRKAFVRERAEQKRETFLTKPRGRRKSTEGPERNT